MAGIKTMELDPSKESIYKTLMDDAVGRNKNLWQFACFCSAQKNRCSIALDSGWGTGKTFFLKQLEMLFDAYNNQPIQLNADEKRQIRELFDNYAKDDKFGITIQSHVCIYYDAWINDNVEDPISSILYCLIKHVSNRFSLKQTDSRKIASIKKKLFDLKESIKRICKFNTNKDLLLDIFAPIERLVPGGGTITDSIKTNNPVHGIEAQECFHNAFNNFLEDPVLNENKRLLILIDELDRCKPSYAVQLLERIKHFLSNKNITFVFAVNENQLQHTISAFYGDNFSSYQYLNRFFDYTFLLPAPNQKRLVDLLQIGGKDANSYLYKCTCETFINVYDIPIREAIKYCQLVHFVCCSPLTEKVDIEDRNWRMTLYIIIPIVIGLRFYNGELLSNFMKGIAGDPLKKVVLSSDVLSVFLHIHTPLKEEYTNSIVKGGHDIKDIKRLEAIYNILFTCNLQVDNQNDAFPFSFNQEMLDTIFQASTLMADFIKFDTNTEETAHG